MMLSQMPEAIDAVCKQLKANMADAYKQGQQFERERIRARAQIAAEKTWKAGDWYIGQQHNMIEHFVEELLIEDGDE